jgi:hypothetical protein
MARAHLLGGFILAVMMLAAPPANAYTPTHTFGPSPTPSPTGTRPPAQAAITVTPNPSHSGQRVVLSGGSGGFGGSGFQWTQVDGDVTVEIEGADQSTASFVVPPLESPAEITVRLELRGGIPAQQVVSLLPGATVRLEVENVIGAPGATIDFDVVMRTLGYEVTALDHEIGFDSFATVSDVGGNPDCLAGEDLSIDSVSFTFIPAGCTPGVDCTAVRTALRTAEPIPDGAVLYRCTVDVGDDESAPSCTHPLACGSGEARTGSGEILQLDCIDGSVTAEYSIRPVSFALVADPPNPTVGDTVHLRVGASGDGGLPDYHLFDTLPFLRVIQLPPPGGGPLGGLVDFVAVADCPGTAPVRIRVNYETRCGCPGNFFYCFTGKTSAPQPVVVRAREGFTVSGHVNEFPLCFGAQRGYTVTIQPLGWNTTTDLSTGGFHFDIVPPGDYTLVVSPSCNPFGCWQPKPIRVTDGDVDVTICPESREETPTIPSTATVTPTSTPTETETASVTPTATAIATATSTATPTNPPGSCCGDSCGGLSFTECQASTDGCYWGDPCLECGEVSSSVNFGGLEIDPAQPKVGDEVTLQFDVQAFVYRVEGVELLGATSFLEEVTVSGTTFRGKATQAGGFDVGLVVSYRSEEACTDPFGNTYYSPGPLRTATSPPYEIEIAEPPTPTATATETPTPSATPKDDGGGSCQLEPGGDAACGWVWCAVALALVASRRRLVR